MKKKIWPSRIIFVFVDGLGIGENNPKINPAAVRTNYFSHFLDQIFPKKIDSNGIAKGIDACLGIPGLPQSASGQTALFTGKNASQILGRHLNGFPNQKLRDVIREYSILKRLTNNGCKAAFLNAFRPPFFDYNPNEIIRHLSVTTVTNLFAGLPFFNVDDIINERAIYQDISNKSLIDKGFDVPVFTPEKAGEILARQSLNYDFTLFEYFQTDRAGHSRNMDRAVNELRILEDFLSSLLSHVAEETLVILTSDHGNIEDISVKGHTKNPALTLLFGKNIEEITTRISSLVDFTPLIVELLCKKK